MEFLSLSRRHSSARNVPIGEERGETDVFAGYLQTKHQIDCDSATCITYSTEYYQRLSLESWFTNLERTPLNHSPQLP